MSADKQYRSDFAEYLFGEGTNFRAYEYLGAHKTNHGVVFRVWAPNADKVFVTGDFCQWEAKHLMSKDENNGIWVYLLTDKNFKYGSRYKYIIERDGKYIYKSDPYAFHSETLADTASLFYDIKGYKWQDSEYMRRREQFAAYLPNDVIPPVPMNVYEVHLGSWRRHSDGSYCTYSELADSLSAYAREMGYTHIELMPVAEHPYDKSWGYQACGYYAPTSRFGTPKDFMAFVDKMHGAGIGVILDWVPAHFPKDEHGLYEFDGSPLYEYQGADKMENRGWGTRCFDVGRTQVQSFLISNALYWLGEYHIDGLRVDAVASMLYLDYDRKPGEWNPNPDGTNISTEAVSFFQKLNNAVRSYYTDCLMIAEESTAYPDVTKKHGLGFSLKWSMGWMNDTLSYIAQDPYFRSGCHEKMTFSMMYAFSENYLLPISHDEVVHGKKSLIDKCFGEYEQKFATVKTFLSYMISHPGKKLLFMGSEFGQFSEWDCEKQLDWFLLEYESHSKLRTFVKDLNHLYLNTPELYKADGSWEGFNWIFADNRADNIFVFERKSGLSSVIVMLNFSGYDREEYIIPVKNSGWYKVIISGDSQKYGGKGYSTEKSVRSRKNADGGNEIKLKSAGCSAILLLHRPTERK